MNLENLRQQIDVLDTQLLALLNHRAQLALEVGKVKAHDGQLFLYQPAREQAILARLTEQNPGPLGNEAISYIFKAIISSCRELQHAVVFQKGLPDHE